MTSAGCKNICVVSLLALLLAWSRVCSAGDESAPARQLLPINNWVKVEEGRLKERSDFDIVYLPGTRTFLAVGGLIGGRYNCQEHLLSLPQGTWEQFTPETAGGAWVPAHGSPTFFDKQGTLQGSLLRRFRSCAFGQCAWQPQAGRIVFFANSSTLAYDSNKRAWLDLKPIDRMPKGPIRWGSLCYDAVNNEMVLVGGNSTDDRGNPGAWIYSVKDNSWRRLRLNQLPLYKLHAECDAICLEAHQLAGMLRSRWHLGETEGEVKIDLSKPAGKLAVRVKALGVRLEAIAQQGKQEQQQVDRATPELNSAAVALEELSSSLSTGVAPGRIALASAACEHLRVGCNLLAVEPPARAYSPLAYDADSEKMVLFGGDHLDYLTADTWVYDCRNRRWAQRHPQLSPAPRAGHTLLYLPKSKRVALIGGYTYGSEEGYAAWDYKYRPLEIWIYDTGTNRWTLLKRWELPERTRRGEMNVPLSPRSSRLVAAVTEDDVVAVYDGRATWLCRLDASALDEAGTGKFGVKPGARERRTGKYVPTWWDQLPPPNQQENEKFLKSIPANTWVAMAPPKVLNRNRDWGTSTFDIDRLQVLWFSGGHCAYSGTDVAIYSTRANHWRISATPEMPIQFCRGTGYHAQNWSFNGRPFMHSHTYKLYAYDPCLQRMILANRDYTFIFDPHTADWEWPPIESPFRGAGGGWIPKFCTTPAGVVVWAPPREGNRISALWRFDSIRHNWQEIQTQGDPVPATPGHDFGTIAYDSKRNQVLLFASNSKKEKTWGWVCDLATGSLRKLVPPNPSAGPRFPRESIYLPGGDVVLFADTWAQYHDEGKTVAVVYDVSTNRFRGLCLANPSAAEKRRAYGGHSCGLMYDPVRKLAWAVYSNWNLRVMRFNPQTAQFVDK